MPRRPYHLMMLPALVLLPAVAHFAGGWAVVTVDDLPDYAVAGQPLTLSYTVRQHGRTLLDGLQGRVEAAAGRLETSAPASPGTGSGRYTATLRFPQPGDWTITIYSGFMTSNPTLLPLRVVAPGTRATALADRDRGRRLFVAKGCVTCHMRAGVSAKLQVAVGPELTERRYPADVLAKMLANPDIIPSPEPTSPRMPNLALKQPEIAALVAFINSERQVSGR